jgi:hypothetical protein
LVAHNEGGTSAEGVRENRMLKRIFGIKRDEVTGEWRSLGNEKRNDLYSSLNIISVLKSKSMRWAGHVEGVGGEERGVQDFGGET